MGNLFSLHRTALSWTTTHHRIMQTIAAVPVETWELVLGNLGPADFPQTAVPPGLSTLTLFEGKLSQCSIT